MTLNDNELKKISQVSPFRVQQYEQYMPPEDNANYVEKLNQVIQSMARIGKLNNDVVTMWNKVMEWITTDTLESIVTSVTNEKLDISLNNGLKELAINVTDDKINELLQSGQFESIVESAITTIHDEVTNELQGFNKQLAEKVGTGVKAKMEDLGQDIKEALTGGSVAVVGVGAVGNVNVQTKAISPEKTTFIEVSSNLMDTNTMQDGYAFSTSTHELVPNSSYGVSDFIKVEADAQMTTANVNYSIRYDANKNYISHTSASTFGTLDAEYIKVQVLRSKYGEAQVNRGSVLLPYEKKYTRLSDAIEIANSGVNNDKVVIAGTGKHPTIQSAIDSLPSSGGNVYIPSGDWIINQTIKVPSNVTLQGAGFTTKIILQANSNCDVIRNADYANGNTNITIKDLYINGDGRNQGVKNTESELQNTGMNEDMSLCGIRLHKCSNSLVKRVHAHNVGWSVDWLQGARAWGIWLRSCTTTNVVECIGSECGYEGIGTRAEPNFPSHTLKFIDCNTYGNRQHGMQLTPVEIYTPNAGALDSRNISYNITVSNLHTWGNLGGNGLIIGHGTHDVSVVGGNFRIPQSGANSGLTVYDGANNVTITGATFVNCQLSVSTNGSHNVSVNGCNFRQTASDVPAARVSIGTGSHTASITGCNFDVVIPPAIQVTGNKVVAQGNVIKFSGISTSSAGGIKVEDGFEFSGIGNKIENTRRGIWIVGNSSNSQLIGNSISVGDGYPIRIETANDKESNQIVVQGNNAHTTSGYPCISIVTGNNHIVTTNIVRGASASKITVSGDTSINKDNIETAS